MRVLYGRLNMKRALFALTLSMLAVIGTMAIGVTLFLRRQSTIPESL